MPRSALPLVALVVLLALAGGASAHGYMVDAEPAPNARLADPPDAVVVRMSEPVLLASSKLQVLDRDGRDLATGPTYQVDGDAATLARAVELPPNATYVAVWTALWESDGHVTHGGWGFVVGNATEPIPVVESGDAGPTATEAGLRALGYGTLVVAFGALLFVALVWVPVERAPAPPALARLAAAAAAVGVAVAAAALVHGASVAGLPVAEYARTRLGLAALARAGLLLALVPAALLARERPAARWTGLAIGVGVAATFTATSHAYATGRPEIMVSDAAHVLAGASWVGGLLALLVVLPAAARRPALAVRFSGLAGVAVAFAVLTGTGVGFVYLGSLDRLATPYGRTLVLKVAVVAGMLALGAVNRVFLVPAVAGRRVLARLRAPEGAFRRVVAVETALGLVVLAVAGVLAGTGYEERPPPLSSGPFVETKLSKSAEIVRADGHVVTLSIDPAEVGLNAANVTLLRASNETPVEAPNRIQLFLNKLEPDGRLNRSVPKQELDLDERGAGRFTGNVTFALAGLWEVTVYVEPRDGLPDAATYRVPIR